MTPEEFEMHFEEAELQIIVEKFAQKTRRDANRQRSRLETDRRLLRSQADSVNSVKWLPPEIMDNVLDLIKAESRFAPSAVSSENVASGKMPAEEDMITRLWTLQQVLAAVRFPEDRIKTAVQHILDIAPSVVLPLRDSIWGLEEALDWLARECALEDLPPYEPKGKVVPRGMICYPVFFFLHLVSYVLISPRHS